MRFYELASIRKNICNKHFIRGGCKWQRVDSHETMPQTRTVEPVGIVVVGVASVGFMKLVSVSRLGGGAVTPPHPRNLGAPPPDPREGPGTQGPMPGGPEEGVGVGAWGGHGGGGGRRAPWPGATKGAQGPPLAPLGGPN
jgi:hypothetical protein